MNLPNCKMLMPRLSFWPILNFLGEVDGIVESPSPGTTTWVPAALVLLNTLAYLTFHRSHVMAKALNKVAARTATSSSTPPVSLIRWSPSSYLHSMAGCECKIPEP